MKHRLAVWLRRSADRLDPPPKSPWDIRSSTFSSGGVVVYTTNPNDSNVSDAWRRYYNKQVKP